MALIRSPTYSMDRGAGLVEAISNSSNTIVSCRTRRNQAYQQRCSMVGLDKVNMLSDP